MGRRKRMVAVCLLAFSLLSTGCTPQADKPADTTSPLTEISTGEETQTSAEEPKEEKEEIVSLLRNPYLHLAKYPEKCLRPAVAERISQALHALPSTGGLCMLMTYTTWNPVEREAIFSRIKEHPEEAETLFANQRTFAEQLSEIALSCVTKSEELRKEVRECTETVKVKADELEVVWKEAREEGKTEFVVSGDQQVQTFEEAFRQLLGEIRSNTQNMIDLIVRDDWGVSLGTFGKYIRSDHASSDPYYLRCVGAGLFYSYSVRVSAPATGTPGVLFFTLDDLERVEEGAIPEWYGAHWNADIPNCDVTAYGEANGYGFLVVHNRETESDGWVWFARGAALISVRDYLYFPKEDAVKVEFLEEDHENYLWRFRITPIAEGTNLSGPVEFCISYLSDSVCDENGSYLPAPLGPGHGGMFLVRQKLYGDQAMYH